MSPRTSSSLALVAVIFCAMLCVAGCKGTIEGEISDGNGLPSDGNGLSSPVKITTESLPTAVVGTPYTATLEAQGENPPYHWSIAEVGLPDGLSLAAETGIISGTPTKEGEFTFTVKVTDNKAEADSKSLSILVTPMEEAPSIYAIVISKETASSDWSVVVANLCARYLNAKVFEYDVDINEIKPDLVANFPSYVCFVHKPPVPREFVQDKVIPFMRDLDDDPYEDAVWAILTGYDIEDAKRISSAEPLEVAKGCSHVGSGWLDWFDSGVSWHEASKNTKYIKEPGEPVEQVSGPSDTTQEFVTALNENDKHCISSSGHASPYMWEMGYTYTSGWMYSGSGKLTGHAQGGSGPKYYVNTTNPKIYFSPGNCLIAKQPSMDCMSLAWMHGGGVNAFFGHVIEQFSGPSCCAWGIISFFFELQDRFTYAEAIYLNRQAAWANPTNWSRCLGGTVLYGDPGWDCRMKRSTTPIYDQTLDVVDKGGGALEITFSITMNMERRLARSVESAAAFLPQRIKNPEVVSCDAEGHAIADNFVVIRQSGTLSKDTTLTIVFTAEKR